MLHKILDTLHPGYDPEMLEDYYALYAGGKCFRDRIGRFLPRHEVESPVVYERRCKEAPYRSYVGPIIDYFAAYLLSNSVDIQPSMGNTPKGESRPSVDQFYSDFKEDCDGAGTDFQEFIRCRIIDSLVCQRSWWEVRKPQIEAAQDKLDFEAQGGGECEIRAIDSDDIKDWERDEDGHLIWVIAKCVTHDRTDWATERKICHHKWTVWDREFVTTFEIFLEEGAHMPEDVPQTSQVAHGMGVCPIIMLDVEEGFWLMNRIAGPQVAHFRLSAGLDWAIKRTCYTMPVFFVAEGKDGNYKPPAMGPGYYMVMGKDEKVEWPSPASAPYDVISKEIAAQKDEIYRLAMQMSLGVDNNAAAVGRSGESKLADAEAVKVILTTLGSLVREQVENTMDLIAKARGEDIEWDVEGFDAYGDTDVAALLTAVQQAILLNIPSPTFEREVKTRAALALVPNSEQEVKDTIRDEIKQNVSDEEVLNRGKLALGGEGGEGNPEEQGAGGNPEQPGNTPSSTPPGKKS